MNRGLLGKSIREVWSVTLFCGLGAMVFEVLLTYAIRTFQEQLDAMAGQWLQLEWIQNILKGLVGTEIGEQLGPGALSSIAWVHPILLALIWAHEITICTRVPAGEVDRGTVDVLFGLPVSRWCIYGCETIVWLAAGAVVLLMALIGNAAMNLALTSDVAYDLRQAIVVISNLFCLYLAVGGLALLVSSLSDRRGRAVAAAFGIVVASFLLNFLAQFSTPIKSFSFLSLLNYYRPLLILRDGAWPIHDMLVLLVCAAVLWLAGGLIFNRRDICTV